MSVESELENPRSILHLYQRLIALRRQWGSLSSGDFQALYIHPNVYGYQDRRFAVLLNFSSSEVAFTTALERGELLLSSELDEPSRAVSLREVRLRPWEGWLVRLIE